ncbi:hypothetical protein [Enterococcus sp. AZ072]|uniref:hypothetical protein n=1 Tax=unclassified Enterococcus TaxID=2608891 RepID=UPI003D27AACC
MLNRQMIQPEKMLALLSDPNEGLFAIRGKMDMKTYQVLLYKYEEDFFLLKNPYLLHLLMDNPQKYLWSDQDLLNSIEETLEKNQYYPVSKEWIDLDLKILKQIENVEIEWFQMEE